MLVSHLCRFIYLKTIKTAGTSVELYFEPFCVAAKDWDGEHHGREQVVSAAGIVGARGSEAGLTGGATWYNHMPAAEVREKLPPEVWNGYHRFCVVRDPWDKVVSQFWYHLNPADRATLATADFSKVRTAMTQWLAGGRLPLDRHIYTIDGRLAVDSTLRYETLSSDLEKLCGQLGIPWQANRLGRYKSGYRARAEAARDYFDGPSSARVREAFAWEFDNLGYHGAGR